MKQKPIVIGVAGGSGSGKTSVARAIHDHFQGGSIMMIEQDYYYKNQSHLTFEERLKQNYDHPFAFDNDLLIEQMQELMNGRPVEKPVYDYVQHTRSNETVPLEPKDVIILEGILVLEDERLRDLMDIKLFVDTDADLRFIRRLTRDITERGRSLDSVVDQYTTIVRPMHNQFIEPTKRYADVIIPIGGENKVAIDIIIAKIQTILEQKDIL
ncbi:uridine kinase [Domibacillus antri]|uniref:Uridine kinase n=1 Tax=Domibacillus antri TaxID=1714264 RepID=A0A1Q8Q7X2_9BACI|nr:uridine kinase [Domibacillus antri]OLN23433.1 uridine kinase [Domibacillus antri]